ncbi:MAG: hypothetical protein WCS85_02325 [Candidatus Peribacteraceae bacterium]
MLRKAILLTGALFLLLPASAWAMQSTVWDFTRKQVPGDWLVTGWSSVTPTDQGLHIQPDTDGNMVRQIDLPYPVDTIRIIVTSRTNAESTFLWHRRNSPEGELIQLPIGIGTGDESVITEDLRRYPEWDPRAEGIGIGLPKGADVTIIRIELISWSPAEKLAAAWKSFWTFDSFNATTINFLWGPILNFSPLNVGTFAYQPPRGWSANRLFYALLIVAGAVAMARWIMQRRTGRRAGSRALRLFLSCTLGLWIFYDVRMGAEFLRNATGDIRNYVFAAPGSKVLGGYGNFYDAIQQSLPLLRTQDTYVAILPERASLLGRMQYLTYPSLPAQTENYLKERVWFVYRRPDILVQDGSLQSRDGTVLAKGGSIVKRFDESSFIFMIP